VVVVVMVVMGPRSGEAQSSVHLLPSDTRWLSVLRLPPRAVIGLQEMQRQRHLFFFFSFFFFFLFMCVCVLIMLRDTGVMKTLGCADVCFDVLNLPTLHFFHEVTSGGLNIPSSQKSRTAERSPRGQRARG